MNATDSLYKYRPGLVDPANMSITPGKSDPGAGTPNGPAPGNNGNGNGNGNSNGLTADDQMLLRMMRMINTQAVQADMQSAAPQIPMMPALNKAAMPAVPPCSMLSRGHDYVHTAEVSRAHPTNAWQYPNRNHLSVTRLINPIYWITKILDHGRRMHCLSMGPNAYGSKCTQYRFPAPEYDYELVHGKANSSALTSVPRTIFEIPRTAIEVLADLIGTGVSGAHAWQRSIDPKAQQLQMLQALMHNPQAMQQLQNMPNPPNMISNLPAQLGLSREQQLAMQIAQHEYMQRNSPQQSPLH